MDYIGCIQKSVNFMEENLSADITLEDCARASGYSLYHFTRIFKLATGLAPMEYVRKRRFSGAAVDLASTGQSVKDIAFRYGFNSLENFIRAFQNEFLVTPGTYRKSNISLHLLDRLDLPAASGARQALCIQPEIICRESFQVYGYCFEMGRGEAHWKVPAYWNYYHVNDLGSTLPGAASEERVDIGISLDFHEDGSISKYVIGVEASVDSIKDADGIGGFVVIQVPAATYAVFHTPVADAFTFVETIHKTWEYINRQWLPASGWVSGEGFGFEIYRERSYLYSEDIYIPIRQRNEGPGQ